MVYRTEDARTIPMERQHTTKAELQQIELVRSICLAPMSSFNLCCADTGNHSWQEMTTYAIRHGLAPLFWRGLGVMNKNILSLNPQEDVDAFKQHGNLGRELFNLLKDSYLSTLRHNMQIQAVLNALDDALAGTEIICMVWKGAALIFDVYPGLGLRPMDDIDLLVSPKHLEQLQRVLHCLGFKPRRLYPLTWHRQDMVLDLHLDVVHGDRISGRLKALPITADILLQESRPLANFRQLVTLSPHDALISLAVHALKHGYSRDIWLTDAVFLMNQFPETVTAPEKLIQRAIDLQASLPLYLLCSLLQSWPQNLKLNFLDRLGPAKLSFIPQLFLESYMTPTPIPYSGELFYLFAMDSYRQKIAFLLETMFPPRHVMHQLFPDRHLNPYWLYYPHRILRLLAMGMETLKALLRFAKRNEEKIYT